MAQSTQNPISTSNFRERFSRRRIALDFIRVIFFGKLQSDESQNAKKFVQPDGRRALFVKMSPFARLQEVGRNPSSQRRNRARNHE